MLRLRGLGLGKVPTRLVVRPPPQPTALRRGAYSRPPSPLSRGLAADNSFWSKWTKATQQQFMQEVAYDHDQKHVEKQVRTAKGKSSDKADDARDDYDDDALGLERSLDHLDDSAQRGASLPGDGAAASEVKAAADMAGARERIFRDDGVDPKRRAELLGLIEELGPAAFTRRGSRPVKELPGIVEEEQQQNIFDGDANKTLRIAPTFLDSVKLRERGGLEEGKLFCLLLHTRRVSKSTGAGKHMSISVLCVVGNGAGSAGYGLGKDADAGKALFKAQREARKNMIYVDRFDGRTIFHDMNEEYRATKFVVRQRRAHSGTRCNWVMWKILYAFGITDVSIKVHGSRNRLSQTEGIFNLLQRMLTPERIAEKTLSRVVDFSPRSSAGKAGFRAD